MQSSTRAVGWWYRVAVLRGHLLPLLKPVFCPSLRKHDVCIQNLARSRVPVARPDGVGGVQRRRPRDGAIPATRPHCMAQQVTVVVTYSKGESKHEA